MTLNKLIENGLLLNFSCTNKDSFFEELFLILKDKKYVNDGFLEAIKKREKEFPTGLETISMGIAVPHVDSEYAKDSALVLCRFAQPIKFYRMDAIETEIDVKEAFVLLVNKSDEHMKALQDLTHIWQSPELLKLIYMAKTKQEIIERLERIA
ncbi:MAG: PTS sugar transporter subunit IIA [Erysipelotrichaceae bacterium]|nr:PTS sugar transporter subunit IIA [Erysipelotrichaceae bacterium]